jgi:two-component system NtrC family sensor kinase
MTLRRKLLLVNAALLVCCVAVAGASLWGLLLQRGHVRGSLRMYAALQRVESAELKVVAAKARLSEAGVGAAALESDILPQLRSAQQDLKTYRALLGMYDRVLPAEVTDSQQAEVKQKTKAALARFASLLASLEAAPASGAATGAAPAAPVRDLSAASHQADQLTAELANLLRVCNGFVEQTELASEHDLRPALFAVGALAVLVPLAALVASLWQYGRIMMPLNRLRLWSRRIAGGDFSESLQPTGDREIVELGQDFNQMASELRAFYRQLEEMVAAKSRELVRSERLASVGYLAAGVAHEINNPLGIMSGYAELSLKRLRRLPEQELVSEVLNWQGVIREEAFRCKQITGKLLSLAKGGSEGREAVSLTRVASDVAIMVRGLRSFRGRSLHVAIDPSDPLEVHANVTELKQVMLNLTVNALEAVSPGTGEVVVDARREHDRDRDWIEVIITDNGRGMGPETIERIFEPFYTDKRGAGEPGTGLGLSITHAIVADHGGEIRAQSDGPGKGSRFTIRLPAHGAAPEVLQTQRGVAQLHEAGTP